MNAKNLFPAKIIGGTKYELQGLRITPEYTEATDSFRLVRVSRTKMESGDRPNAPEGIEYALEGMPGYTLDAGSVEQLAKILPAKPNLPVCGRVWEMAGGDKNSQPIGVLNLDAGGWAQLNAHKVDGDWPDTKAIWPKDEPKAILKINPKYLKDAADLVMKFAGKDCKSMDIQYLGEDKPLIVETTAHGQTMTQLIMPVKSPVKS